MSPYPNHPERFHESTVQCLWDPASNKKYLWFCLILLMSCDIYRWRVSHVEWYLESKVSTFRHRGARLRSVRWASQHGGVESERVWRCPQWEESSIQKKWSHTWSSDIGRSVWQVSESLTANWSATYRQLCHPKWRLDRQWLLLYNSVAKCSGCYRNSVCLSYSCIIIIHDLSVR